MITEGLFGCHMVATVGCDSFYLEPNVHEKETPIGVACHLVERVNVKSDGFITASLIQSVF